MTSMGDRMISVRVQHAAYLECFESDPKYKAGNAHVERNAHGVPVDEHVRDVGTTDGVDPSRGSNDTRIRRRHGHSKSPKKHPRLERDQKVHDAMGPLEDAPKDEHAEAVADQVHHISVEELVGEETPRL